MPEFTDPLNMEAAQALGENLRRHTIAMIDVRSSGERELSTGTLITIGGHLLIATAAHCIPNKPQGRLAFVSTRREDIQNTLLRIVGFHKHDGDWPDIGYIEIDPTQVTELTGKAALTADRIKPRGPGVASRQCMLAGYPAALGSPHPDAFGLQCSIYNPNPLPPRLWPKVPKHAAKPKPDRDIFLPFIVGKRVLQHRLSVTETMPDPKGMSGGGIWQDDPQRGIWTAERWKLFGIQARRDEAENKTVRGVQIIHWLKLLNKHIRGLRPELEERFSRAAPSAALAALTRLLGSVPASPLADGQLWRRPAPQRLAAI